jgi:hypothetical protein
MIGDWAYWILGTYDSHSDTLALTTGGLRGCESLGSTFSYAVGSSKHAWLFVNLILAAVPSWASVPTTTCAAWIVPDLPKGEVGSDDEVREGQFDSIRVMGKSGVGV